MLALNPKTDEEQSEITNHLQKVSENNEKHPLPHHFEDYIIQTTKTHHLQMTKKYVDDIGWVYSEENTKDSIYKKKKHCRQTQRKKSTHQSNQTENYRIKKDSDDSCKKCK